MHCLRDYGSFFMCSRGDFGVGLQRDIHRRVFAIRENLDDLTTGRLSYVF